MAIDYNLVTKSQVNNLEGELRQLTETLDKTFKDVAVLLEKDGERLKHHDKLLANLHIGQERMWKVVISLGSFQIVGLVVFLAAYTR